MKKALILLAICIAACGTTEEEEEEETTNTSGLVLDFTVFVPGAIQVSGMGVSPNGREIAVVTDLERLVVVDAETVMPTADFSVQFGDLPQQGSSEALAYLSTDTIAVLYPDHKTVRTFVNEEATGSIDLAGVDGVVHGAMAIDADTGSLYVVAGTGPLFLVEVAVEGGAVRGRQELEGEIAAEVVGLSLDPDSSNTLWAVTGDNQAFTIDRSSGAATAQGSLPEVGESSACEAFYNLEGEAVLGVSDDDDQYNAEPGPIRLYLFK